MSKPKEDKAPKRNTTIRIQADHASMIKAEAKARGIGLPEAAERLIRLGHGRVKAVRTFYKKHPDGVAKGKPRKAAPKVKAKAPKARKAPSKPRKAAPKAQTPTATPEAQTST